MCHTQIAIAAIVTGLCVLCEVHALGKERVFMIETYCSL